MARLTIPDEQTFAEFSVVTSTTDFPVSFSLFAKADLTVLVDGTDVGQAAFSFSGTLLDGGGYDGGTVVLNTAVDDVTVRIERNVAPARTSNFAPAASTPVGAVDQALNRVTAVQQDHSRRIDDAQGDLDDFAADVAHVDAQVAAVQAIFGVAGEVQSGASVTFLNGGTGPIATDVQTKLRMLPRSVTEYLTVQAALTDAHTNTHALFFPTGLITSATGLSVDFDARSDDPMLWKGEGFCISNYAKGSTFKFTGSGSAALTFINVGANTDIQNSPFVLEDFAIVGDSPNAAKSDGIIGPASGILEFRNMLSADHGGHGYNLTRGYAVTIRGGFVFGNWGDGIRFTEAANRIALENVTSFANGRDPAVLGSNIRINCASNPAFGATVTNCDVSYGGRDLCSVALGTLTSIVVSGGVATANAPAHGLTTGFYVSQIGGAVDLNTTPRAFFSTITVTGPDTFTWATSAANGTYNDADLRIKTYCYGFLAGGLYGATIRGLFCEEPSGWGAYYSSTNFGVLHHGGFMLQGWIGVENAQNVEVDGVHFRGARAGLYVTEVNDRATNNVGAANTFVDGATLVLPSFYMRNGVRYGPSTPTTGTWAVGEYLLNSAPSAANPWTRRECVTAGTPGTFRTTAWMTYKDTTANRPTLTAIDVGVSYLDTTLDADGKPITWTGTAWVDATGAVV